MKERRAHPRIEIIENVMFGEDKPIHNGISDNLSPGGMSIISDKALVPLSNIIIKIYVKKIAVVNTKKLEIITVEGEVIWVKLLPDAPSMMGIKFNKPNEKLIRIYRTLKPRSK